jgi:hypothetical protein
MLLADELLELARAHPRGQGAVGRLVVALLLGGIEQSLHTTKYRRVARSAHLRFTPGLDDIGSDVGRTQLWLAMATTRTGTGG